jgi:hypothetical protein
MFASGARAEESLVNRHFSLTGGMFIESSSTKLTVEGETPGSQVDFENELGLDDNANLSRFRFDWHFAKNHSARFGYYALNRRATKTIDQEIIFDDQVYPVDATVKARFKSTFYEASYTYWIMERPKSAFGVTGGIVAMSNKAELKIEPTSGGATTEVSGKSSTDLPVILIGASYRHMFSDNWLVTADATFLPSVTYDNYSGSSTNVNVAVEYEFLQHYGVGLAYDTFGIDFEAEGDNAIAKLDYKIDGPQVYFKFFW